ncbi:MAG: hypothetical protein GY796_02070 [Chloroflexi bacterium]|nr:hypothetical protein [Chloroflexota bacterium]
MKRINTQASLGSRILFIVTFFLIWMSGCSLLPGGHEEPLPDLILMPPPTAAYDSLTRLTQAAAPERDMPALVSSFQGTPIQRIVEGGLPETPPGETAAFWVTNNDDASNRQIDARLLAQTADLNMWVEEGLHVDSEELLAAANKIEAETLPANRAFFGTEWQPGIDGDNRINILHAEKLGQNVAAYYSASDEMVTAVNPFSNQREMLYVNMDGYKINSDDYHSTIAHELQHLIQWHTDKNEEGWMGEGLSELASYLSGYPPDRAADFVAQTDLPLTNLSQQPDVIAGHYAAAYLFANYFYERFGAEATQALVTHPANGLVGVDGVLAEMGESDTAVTLYADWLADTYLAGAGYETPYQIEIPALEPHIINRFPADGLTAVYPFGADIYQIENDSPVSLIFTGTQQTRLVDAAPHSGRFVYATLPADESDMRLTRPFDLTDLDSAALTFWTWYDIEEGWDYAYVTVSSDDGQTWDILETASTTLDNPQGNSFGPGYSGLSGGGETAVWIQETADLTPYAGQEILLRFQYVTDDAVHEAGFLVDDIAIPELGYQDNAEQDGGWQEEGLIRSSHILPQSFIVQRILLTDDGPVVEQLPLDENNQAVWKFPLDGRNRRAILIVSGSTAVTNQRAAYQYEWRE